MLWNMFVVALMAITAQASERVVDLTPKGEHEIRRVPGQPRWREGLDCRGRSTGRVGPAPPLSLAIVKLDRSELSMGGQFAVDIRVTNNGTEPVVVPTALAYELGDDFTGGSYALRASLGIVGVDAEGREHSLSGVILHGSPSQPDTIESLNPGQSLTIHFPGWTLGTDGPDAPVTGDAQLFARLLLTDNQCRDWQAVSSRRVNIRLRGRD